MLDCSKKCYPSQRPAERALQAVQESCRVTGRRDPTGSYWCSICKAWRLTSKSKSQNSELGQDETIFRRCRGVISTRGDRTHLLTARIAADEGVLDACLFAETSTAISRSAAWRMGGMYPTGLSERT